jgi:hypothetical protein
LSRRAKKLRFAATVPDGFFFTRPILLRADEQIE